MNVVEKAKQYALEMHGEQKYGEKPYFCHLESVVNILLNFGITDEILIASAWLHDVVEDTPAIDFEQNFPNEIVELVKSVTSESGINRKERNLKTYPKIRAIDKAVLLKLADRLANVRESVYTNDSKLKMYKKEYPDFRKALKFEENCLWDELDYLLG